MTSFDSEDMVVSLFRRQYFLAVQNLMPFLVSLSRAIKFYRVFKCKLTCLIVRKGCNSKGSWMSGEEVDFQSIYNKTECRNKIGSSCWWSIMRWGVIELRAWKSWTEMFGSLKLIKHFPNRKKRVKWWKW